MALQTQRLAATPEAALGLEVTDQIAPASTLMWHLEKLKGLRVVAKKSWALTDDFEAYFLYRDRLYLMQTPWVEVWILQLGSEPDPQGFSEVEAAVQSFPAWKYMVSLVPIAKYFFLPFNPSAKLLARYGALPVLSAERGDGSAA